MIIQDAFVPPPCQPNSISHEELRRLEKVEKQIAQKFEMDSPHGIDSVAVLEEARKRDNLPFLKRTAQALVRKVNPSAATSSNNDVAELEKLYYIRRHLAHEGWEFEPVSQSSIPVNRGVSSLSLAIDARARLNFLRSHTTLTRRFLAVLIGINAYEDNPLSSCVSDALLMKKFLVNLGVPESRIQCLLGDSRNPIPDDHCIRPSRDNIINTLYNLIYNHEIRKGDNIIVYYAGHGASYHCSEHDYISMGNSAVLHDYASPYNRASAHDASKSKCQTGACPIEALCPIDRDTLDSDKQWIPDISDREINALFEQISRAKGHKITFIADCCHASGTSRGPNPETCARAMGPACNSDIKDMLRAADNKLGHLPHYQPVSSKRWKPVMNSHVILAACREYQIAKETRMGKQYGGEFTRNLVDVLNSGSLEKGLTYVELTNYLNRLPSQTPVVAGDHKNKPIWYQEAS